MKRTLLVLGMAALSVAVQAQITQPVIPPGKIAVFKAGVSNGVYTIVKSRVNPCFVQVFDPVMTNQASPLLSIAMSTNVSVPGSVWINAHAGSEGGAISRSIDRQFLALEGYTGDILSPTAAKPSTNLNVTRGIVTLDAFTNAISVYNSTTTWFGIPPGSPNGTQDNPTGVATTDGTNFWGTGNFSGGTTELPGTLFYNPNVGGGLPQEIQNLIQAAAEARIIGGTLYFVEPSGNGVTAGVYNFLNANPPYAVVPLPFDPNVPDPYQTVALTNLFLNWGTTFQNIANFDMNAAGTIAYGADETYGIVKFTNNGSAWVQAPYYFNSTNLGTTLQPAAQQGCFGICVDFSGTNPIIYATTMEYGAGTMGNSVGNPNNNRLISIVDSGNPGTNLVAQTLATATSTNEVFRGIDFTPDLRPLITSEPVGVSTTNGGSATFTVTAASAYPLSYQWLQNGTNLNGATNASVTLSDLTTNDNGYTYECVVTNDYGDVTSAPPANLTVTFVTVAPAITNAVVYLTNFIGQTVTFAPIFPNGTEPFAYQWYHDGTNVTDDGVTYSGSETDSLTITNLATDNSGVYALTAQNPAGTASNVVYVISVEYQLPVINAGGQPQSVTAFVGGSASLLVTPSGGTLPQTTQWQHAGTNLVDGNEYSGSQDNTLNTLTINPVGFADAGPYTVIIANGGGSVTSQVATVTVLVAPPLSSVSYSNQIYSQNFDSLPDPGSNSVNSFNNPQLMGAIDGVQYSLANPFDFSYPILTSSFLGGLGLSNTMSGWYGACDTDAGGFTPDGITRFGAQDGDQTTGGVIDFGPNDDGSDLGTNRALGLLSTSTTGSTTFALKLVNTSANALNYVDISCIGELWHQGTGSRIMTVGYTLDSTATNFVLTPESIGNSTLIGALAFSFPVAGSVSAVDGTSPAYQTNLSVANLQLVSPWQTNAALWLIWSINYYGSGSGNGYAIDNLNFRATATASAQATTPLLLTGLNYVPGTGMSFGFTNAPGATFTVYYATSLTAPIHWQPIGSPTEVSSGSFSFTDTHATNRAGFYQVKSN